MTDWPEALVEDYLTILENLILLAEEIGTSMDLVPGAIDGNIPIFDDAGQVEDSGSSFNDLEFETFFVSRNY